MNSTGSCNRASAHILGSGIWTAHAWRRCRTSNSQTLKRFRASNLADRLTQDMDRRARNLNLLVDAARALRAIDHDAWLFLDRAMAQRAPFRFDLLEGHVLGDRSLSTPSVPSLGFDAVDHASESWIAATRLSRAEMTQRLHDYAQAFAAAR